VCTPHRALRTSRPGDSTRSTGSGDTSASRPSGPRIECASPRCAPQGAPDLQRERRADLQPRPPRPPPTRNRRRRARCRSTRRSAAISSRSLRARLDGSTEARTMRTGRRSTKHRSPKRTAHSERRGRRGHPRRPSRHATARASGARVWQSRHPPGSGLDAQWVPVSSDGLRSTHILSVDGLWKTPRYPCCPDRHRVPKPATRLRAPVTSCECSFYE